MGELILILTLTKHAAKTLKVVKDFNKSMTVKILKNTYVYVICRIESQLIVAVVDNDDDDDDNDNDNDDNNDDDDDITQRKFSVNWTDAIATAHYYTYNYTFHPP
ncbi:uncharacterized protein ACN427_014721 [Glossina fuscipes fuscipes]